jgi:deoxyribodipyrimidine photolyase
MLPAHLAERLEPGAPPPRCEGRFVVYWMRVAVRATENPALDVALTAARALRRPVFVLHPLSEDDAFASDRRHTFVLEGARDVRQQLAARGVGYACHLGRGAGALLALAKEAALVVTDFMPVEPLLSADAAVAQLAPLWRVDASCVAPL